MVRNEKLVQNAVKKSCLLLSLILVGCKGNISAKGTAQVRIPAAETPGATSEDPLHPDEKAVQIVSADFVEPTDPAGLPFTSEHFLRFYLDAGESGTTGYQYAFVEENIDCAQAVMGTTTPFSTPLSTNATKDGIKTLCIAGVHANGSLTSRKKTSWILDSVAPVAKLKNKIPAFLATGNYNAEIESADVSEFKFGFSDNTKEGCVNVVWSEWNPGSKLQLKDNLFKTDGAKVLCLIGQDLAKNRQQIPTYYEFILDRNNPSLSIESNSDLSPDSTTGPETKISGFALDPTSGILAINFTLREDGAMCLNAEKTAFDASCDTVHDLNFSTDKSGKSQWSLDLADSILFHRSVYRLEISATDSAGNKSTLASRDFSWILTKGTKVFETHYSFLNRQIDSLTPGSSAIDSAGNIYVFFSAANPANYVQSVTLVVRKYDKDYGLIWEWRKAVGSGSSYAKAITLDSNGEIVLAAEGLKLVSDVSGLDWWVAKLNTAGLLVWEKSFGGTASDSPLSLLASDNGSFFIGGYGTNIASGTSGGDMWLRKLDLNGDPIAGWDKIIHINSNEQIRSLAVDTAGNLYVAGSGFKLVNSTSGFDWIIKKYNSAGTEVVAGWNKISGNISNLTDHIFSVTTDSSDNVYVGGVWNTQGRIEKYNSAGVSQSGYPKTIVAGASSINSLVVDASDRLFAGGYGTPGTSGRDFWLKGFLSNGTEILDYKFSQPISASDEITKLHVDPNSANRVLIFGGSAIYNGASNVTTGLIKSIATDTGIQASSFDVNNIASRGDDEVRAIADLANGQTAVVGYVRNYVSLTSGMDAFVYRLDRRGKFIEGSLKVYDSGGLGDLATAVVAIPGGGFYVGGQSNNLINSTSQMDWWIRKYDSNGEEITSWKKVYGLNQTDELASMQLDNQGNLYVGGTVTEAVGPGTGKDAVIVKYSPDGTAFSAGWPVLFDESNSANSIIELLITSDQRLITLSKRFNIFSYYSYRVKSFSLDGVEDTVNWNKAPDTTYIGNYSGWYNSMFEAVNGDIVFAGYLQENAICFEDCDNQKALIARYSKNGALVYEIYPEIGYNELVYKTVPTSDNQMILVGSTSKFLRYDSQSDASIWTLDSQGNWDGVSKGFGSLYKNDIFYAASVTAGGDTLVGGSYYRISSETSNMDNVVVKFSSGK